MDSLVFSEFCDRYCNILRKEERKRLGLNELTPLQPQRNHLDDDDFDVHLVEGNRAKDLEFGPLNVEAE